MDQQNSNNRGAYRGGRNNNNNYRGGRTGGGRGGYDGGADLPRGGRSGGENSGGYVPRGGRSGGADLPRGGRGGDNGGGYVPRGGRTGGGDYVPRGGRSGYAAVLDGGGYVPRGGRSGGGNNYPRGGGRNYSKQEEYSGGSELPRGGNRTGVLVSGGSSDTQNLTNRVADLQIQEPRVSPPRTLEHSRDGQEIVYLPIKRPDHGTLAVSKVKLLVNHFRVKFSPSSSILRYDVDIKKVVNEDASSFAVKSAKKPIPKSDLRLIQEQLCSDYPQQFPLLQTAFDGEKNIYSAVELHTGIYNVQLFGRSYTCTIKYGNELNLSKLQEFMIGNSTHVPRDVLQALDVVMKANLFREKVSVGRGMYPRVHRREDDLQGGIAAYRGSQQSLKITSNGLVLCPDYSALPFRKRMAVIDYLKEYIYEINHANDIAKFPNYVMAALKGLRVSVIHRRTKQKYIVSGLSEQLTRDISFEQVDPEGNNPSKVVMLVDYFRDKWGKEIEHLNIPCLNLGNANKANYVPLELCFLADDRRFPKEELGREAAKKLRDLSLLAPEMRRREITNMVQQEYATGKNGAEVIKNFDFEVDMVMTEVDGRVMAPPRLRLGSLSGKMNTTTVDRQKCHWNLLQGKTLVTGKTLERWALIDFSNKLNANLFIPNLIDRCRSIGIQMEEPILVEWSNMRELSDVNRVRRTLVKVVEDCRRKSNGRLQMIICVMAETHQGYKSIKLVSETELGVITQCCLSKNANKEKNDQTLANLGMKINAKLGGSNVELIERFPGFSSEDHVMFVGADVNHPAASNTSSPSIAAVVGSINWPAATRYAARVSPQRHRKEEIVNFGSLCLDLVNTYAKVNGVKPNKIVVFRDGVSDGQFDMVLNKEMVDMKKTIYTESYRPWVTFVVAQKRHTTRLFLNNGREVGNVPPGTVVDTEIVHPFDFDFYLCSHFGGIGTSKPTHYSVIWDENKFTSDEMQKMVYHLCYLFARCTKPVSLVPPVYYADLVAYRGRMFQEVAMEMEAAGSVPSSFNQYFYNLESNLKDSMFFV